MAIYAIDFDGTLAETRFPEIIGPKEKMVEFVKAIQAAGNKTILWTSRAGEDLDNAVEWCREQGIIFDAVNENIPEHTAKWGNDTRKIYADYYIDDKAITVDVAEAAGIITKKGEEIIDFLKTVTKQTKEDILTWEITGKKTVAEYVEEKILDRIKDAGIGVERNADNDQNGGVTGSGKKPERTEKHTQNRRGFN